MTDRTSSKAEAVPFVWTLPPTILAKVRLIQTNIKHMVDDWLTGALVPAAPGRQRVYRHGRRANAGCASRVWLRSPRIRCVHSGRGSVARHTDP
jgi:hypothetical protein